jgi:hypothetical protein
MGCHAEYKFTHYPRFNTFAPDAAYDLRMGNSRRTIIRTVGLTLSLASGVMLAFWVSSSRRRGGCSRRWRSAPVGNGLSQLPTIAAEVSVHPRVAGAASGLLGSPAAAR